MSPKQLSRFLPQIRNKTDVLYIFMVVVTRLLVSAHFIYELQDKIRNFNYWADIIETEAGYGSWSMWLIIVLLSVGTILLLFASRFWLLILAFVCLAIFQIPTSVMFEDSTYESMDSTSALGGVLAIALHSWEAKSIDVKNNVDQNQQQY